MLYSFTYVGNRIRWIVTLEMLKIFTKNAIGQKGKWISSDGKYKKFLNSNSDLLSHGIMLTFIGNVGDNLKELFVIGVRDQIIWGGLNNLPKNFSDAPMVISKVTL